LNSWKNALTNQGPLSPNRQEKPLPIGKITEYYPLQFAALRSVFGISQDQYLKSIRHGTGADLNGGKSEAKFMKTIDELFVLKVFPESREIQHFLSSCPKYFKYMFREVAAKSMPSVLCKIFGFYEVKGEKTMYMLVMENLEKGMDPDHIKKYDLKGSDSKRFADIKKKMDTTLDTNYRIDRNGDPLVFESKINNPDAKYSFDFFAAIIND
jgi:hypothetical protein